MFLDRLLYSPRNCSSRIDKKLGGAGSRSRKSPNTLVIHDPRWFIVMGKLSYWLIGWSMIGKTRLDRHSAPLSSSRFIGEVFVKRKPIVLSRWNPLASCERGRNNKYSSRSVARATGNALQMKLPSPRFKTNPFQRYLNRFAGTNLPTPRTVAEFRPGIPNFPAPGQENRSLQF